MGTGYDTCIGILLTLDHVTVASFLTSYRQTFQQTIFSVKLSKLIYIHLKINSFFEFSPFANRVRYCLKTHLPESSSARHCAVDV